MTTLNLRHVSIAPAADLSDILFIAQYAHTADVSASVGIRRYAGGRDRVISTPGQSTQLSVGFRYLSRADYQALVDLVGVLVLFRDQRERAVWGVIGNLSATEWIVDDLLEDVTFTLTSVTVSEAV